jgi:hypothetical protein
MSLNQLLSEGKVGLGLDLECKSVTSSSNLDVGGNLKVEGVKYGSQNVLVLATALGAYALTPTQLVDGIIVLRDGFTGSLVLPLTASIDALFPTTPANGSTFSCSIVNATANEITMSSSEIPAQKIPAHASVTASSFVLANFYKTLNTYFLLLK